MSITTNTTAPTFNSAKVQKGDFIRAKYRSWEKPHNGLVANVTEDEIHVLYVPDIGNVTNYFVIPIAEVAEGLWTLSVSADMEAVETEGGNDDA